MGISGQRVPGKGSLQNPDASGFCNDSPTMNIGINPIKLTSHQAY